MTWWALAVGAAVAALLGAASASWRPRRLLRENHAGRPVPATLGIALVTAMLLGAAVGDWDRMGTIGAVVLAGLAALLLVGLADDLAGGSARGLWGHLRSAARGRPTTGALKLAAGVAAGVAVAVAAGGSTVRIVAGAVLVATAVNVFNALDVVPGRSLKWAAVVLVACLPALWATAGATAGATAAAAGLGAALGALPIDLRERAMLGDAGSNPLGFLVGAAALLSLPTGGVVAAAVAALALQAAAETVTISRLLAAVPPLAWLDAVGRRRE